MRLSHLIAAAVVAGALGLGGCVTPKVIDYKSFHARAFSARSKPAQVQQKGTAELIQEGYLLIGYIDLRRNVQSCYDDGQCVQHSQALPDTHELRREAAVRGGDVVTTLEERTVLEATTRADCTSFSATTTRVNNTPVVTVTCSSYNYTPGKLEARINRALIWRHDPQAAQSDANAKAIDAAVQTLEAVARRPEGPGTGAIATALDALFGGKKRKELAAERAADDLARRIIASITLNDHAAFGELARSGALQTWKDSDGVSALMIALGSGHLEAARAIASLAPGVGQKDARGLTALHHAVMHADLALVRQLVAAGHSLQDADPNVGPLLFYSAVNADPAVYEWLIAQGLDARVRDAEGTSMLHMAAGFGRIGLIEHLIAEGFDPNLADASGTTPLMSAAQHGGVDAVRALLKAGAQPHAADQRKRTAIQYAAYGGANDAIELLQALGLRIDVEDGEGRSPLIEAITAKQWSTVELLLSRKVPLTTSKFPADWVCAVLIEDDQPRFLAHYFAAFPKMQEQLRSNPEWLHRAAKWGGEASIAFLLALGANINGATARSVSPLMSAATEGNVATTRALLLNKADASLRDPRGRTALQAAIHAGHAEVVGVMRELGVEN